MALLAPYVEGTLFVRALRREGGWARVDEAWDSPPTTTEQVLHPDKWRAHEAALRVPDPRGPSAAPNLSLAEANTYGELGLRLAFAEWMGEGAASIAAAGWGGDRTALFTSGDGEAAFAWHITFDEAAPLPMTAFAVRAFDALARALGPSHRIPPRATQSLCIERPGNGALVLARAERDLFVVVGSTETGAHAWAPKMSCKETVAWAEELRSSRGPSAPLLH
jgi:hypothetical protein